MSYDANVVFVQEFFDEVHVLAQQMGSETMGTTREKTLNAKSGHFDRIGAVSMIRRSSRHADTPLLNTPFSRRRVTMDDFDAADLIDNVDEVRMNMNMQSEMVQNFARALNRQRDDTHIAALNASSVAVAADDTTSSVTLASYASGAHVIANGGTNLTMTKIRQASRLMNAADVPKEDRYFLYSPVAMEKLLSDTQVTSSDFNTSTVGALSIGGFPKDAMWMGFKWRMTTRLPISGNIRSCFAYQKNGMGVATGAVRASGRVDERPDKNYATQVYACLVIGAVRIEEPCVVQIDIDETA